MDSKHELVAGTEKKMEDLWYYTCLLSPRPSSTETQPRQKSSADSSSEEPIRISIPTDSAEASSSEMESAKAKTVQGMFRMMDEDGDGTVSASEMCVFMDRLGMQMPTHEVEPLVKAISENGNHFLTRPEFEEMYCILFGDGNDKEDDEAELFQAFQVFDENQDGVISAHEIVLLLRKLGYGSACVDEENDEEEEWRCREMIRRIDRNADGVIDFQEFRLLMSFLSIPC